MIGVADAAPLRYLILIDADIVLPELFRQVLAPPAVVRELSHENTPPKVRRWIAEQPPWLEIVATTPRAPGLPVSLGAGEVEAIALAEDLRAAALITDDRTARQAALQRGIDVIGTLGLLETAAHRGVLDLPQAVDRLRMTNFRAHPRLLNELLDRHRKL